jgi:lipopolysaccharide transport system permease protein
MNLLVDPAQQVPTTTMPGERLPDMADAVPLTEIRPPQGWQLINLRELWNFRDLLYFLTWRDVKVRYKQTLLGAAWAVLQPAMMMVVFTIFFARLARVSSGDIPYPLFAYAGLLLWSFFATAIANAGNSVVGSERLITKVYFPRLAIPLAAVSASLVDFAIAFGLLVVLMICYGILPGPGLLLVPLLLALVFLAAAGMGTLLAALNVAYRDFRYILPFLVQLWMFATPTIYLDLNAEGFAGASPLVQAVLYANPMTGLVAAFRAATLGGHIPWLMLASSTATVAGMFVIGCLYFRKVEDGFADII